ncbi:MAG: helix-turn-helix domain-containing protein [Paracholeplasma sp.]|jgi:DNA-binding HxlR family transcriptional regulator|uniref:Predicted transcriptional regulator n=1 Tax=Acholeplasma brassicae TaxID=61635 RepID=U4KPS8_9MOLU|nr:MULTISPECIES: helix-turn-helix domain-containing protein [Paracholeplasma]MDY3195485.1 helix-turn-helix domain-containing protein [Paracholeplasma sp.]CCV66472.1 Predicted transcriptional regulator [Paracholeplasma brassicae]
MATEICSRFEEAFKLLGKRWTGLIINQLLDGAKRFNVLESEVKISGKVLSERLKELESLGIVSRFVYPETPVRIEYALTKKGYALKPIMDEVANWSVHWID